ncbi:MAG: dienelactone hydrolase family protein, partial [Candidatus Binatia bacterium]
MKRNNQVWIVVVGIVVFCLVRTSVLWAAPVGIVTRDVAYHSGHKDVKGFLARPKDHKKHPAVILIHEWWGLNQNIKENARRFARLGYVSLAVDLYSGRVASKRSEARQLAGGVRKDTAAAFENLRQAVNYLKGRSSSVMAERIASVGWCFGGGWSYQMAKNNLGVKASVIYYGRFNPKDDLSKM